MPLRSYACFATARHAFAAASCSPRLTPRQYIVSMPPSCSTLFQLLSKVVTADDTYDFVSVIRRPIADISPRDTVIIYGRDAISDFSPVLSRAYKISYLSADGVFAFPHADELMRRYFTSSPAELRHYHVVRYRLYLRCLAARDDRFSSSFRFISSLPPDARASLSLC